MKAYQRKSVPKTTIQNFPMHDHREVYGAHHVAIHFDSLLQTWEICVHRDFKVGDRFRFLFADIDGLRFTTREEAKACLWAHGYVRPHQPRFGRVRQEGIQQVVRRDRFRQFARREQDIRNSVRHKQEVK